MKPLLAIGNDNSAPELLRYQNWIKPHQLDMVAMIVDMGSWAVNPWEGASTVSWIKNILDQAQWKGRVHWTVALILHNNGDSRGTSLAAAGKGEYVPYWKKLAQNILAISPNDNSDIYIRPGSEANADGWGYTWGYKGREEDYKKAFALHSKTFKDVSPRFKHVYCCAIGNLNPRLGYAGKPAVDVIDVDFYLLGQFAYGKTPAQYWQESLTKPYGLNFFAQFAKEEGLPLGFSELGVGGNAATKKAWQDVSKPIFEGLTAFVKANDVAYLNYWDRSSDPNAICELSDGQSPNAGAAYKAMIGAFAAGGATPAPTPTPTPPPPAPTTESVDVTITIKGVSKTVTLSVPR